MNAPSPRPRYQTLKNRRAKIVKAVDLLIAAEADWPSYSPLGADVQEVVGVLHGIVREIDRELAS